MKKGISVHADYDANGRWHLVIEKARGTLTLEEIKEVAQKNGAYSTISWQQS